MRGGHAEGTYLRAVRGEDGKVSLVDATQEVLDLRVRLADTLPFMHQFTRRLAPGYRDHGLVGHAGPRESQAHEAGGSVEMMGKGPTKAREVCLGCELARWLRES